MAFGITFENKTAELKTTLSDLKIKVPEIESAAIVSIEGLPIASVLPQEIEEARLAAMTAAMLSLGERVAQEMQRGELEKIFIEGAYGYLCFQSGVGTAAARLRIAAQDKTLLSFGIRRMPPEIAPTIDRACYIAGFDGISCVLSADKLGIPATGTIPHALIMIEGGIAQAVQSFDRHIDSAISRVALADTFNDERVEVLQALEA
ncbi:unnamed protein product, partial [marine sediment metagenome]